MSSSNCLARRLICLIRSAVSSFFAGPIVVLKSRVPEQKYTEMLADLVHPIVQALLPAGEGICQNDNASIHTAKLVQP
ncbi:hypothetical protein TNCV_377541 [Trichonephila clavipes]|nr:hypothetical protein TNCV_377541 [Trichonephila clavipes]